MSPVLAFLLTLMAGGIEFDTRVRIDPALLDALTHGVTLHFVAQARSCARGWPRRCRSVLREKRELEYHLLSENFALRAGNDAEWQSYDSIETVEQALRTIEIPEQARFTGTELEVRIWLDRGRLPSALQIPSLFDPGLRLDSGWLPVDG